MTTQRKVAENWSDCKLITILYSFKLRKGSFCVLLVFKEPWSPTLLSMHQVRCPPFSVPLNINELKFCGIPSEISNLKQFCGGGCHILPCFYFPPLPSPLFNVGCQQTFHVQYCLSNIQH